MTRKLVVGLVAVALVAFAGWGTVQAQKAAALASADTEWSGIQADLLEVKRMSDNTVRVQWRWRNTTDKKVDLLTGFQYGSALKNETYMLDPTNKKKHMVVTDSKGNFVASTRSGQSVMLKANEAVTLWAKFPAPPANVEKVTVVVARTPPFEDVPIAK